MGRVPESRLPHLPHPGMVERVGLVRESLSTAYLQTCRNRVKPHNIFWPTIVWFAEDFLFVSHHFWRRKDNTAPHGTIRNSKRYFGNILCRSSERLESRLDLGCFCAAGEFSICSRCFLQRRREAVLSKTFKSLKPSNPSCNICSWISLVLPAHASTLLAIIKMAQESIWGLKLQKLLLHFQLPGTMHQQQSAWKRAFLMQSGHNLHPLGFSRSRGCSDALVARLLFIRRLKYRLNRERCDLYACGKL